MPIRPHLCLAMLSLAVLTNTSPVLADDASTITLGTSATAKSGAPAATGSQPKTSPAKAAQQATATASSPVDPGVGKLVVQDKMGSTPPEYKRPTRWGLTAGGSQRKDWLTGKNRFDWPTEYNAKKTLGLPDWLNASLEFRSRYESMDTPWAKGQTGSQYQIPLQTVLWMEANYQALRVGLEFWDARQYGTNDYAWNQEQKNAVFAGIFAEAFRLPWDTSGELYLY